MSQINFILLDNSNFSVHQQIFENRRNNRLPFLNSGKFSSKVIYKRRVISKSFLNIIKYIENTL